ncbi:MAG TPA: DUF5672 family protein [Nitrospiraceae bacterium]
MPKPNLNNVTLLCTDTTPKSALAARAIEKSLEQATFGAVKLLTNHNDYPYCVRIPVIQGIAEYSNFCVRDLHRHFDTSHVLVIQADGYALNGGAWTDEFLKYDYIGAPWQQWALVGNGGFSLRSKKLCELLASHPFGDQPHPEDNYICHRHRGELERLGIKFCPLALANQFAFEGRSWNTEQWQGLPLHHQGQFGFHSYLTPLRDPVDRPLVFHHSGDAGDVIYGLAAMRAAGGGVLFFSPDNRFPHPCPTQAQRGDMAHWSGNIGPLCAEQSYCWSAHYTQAMPFSTDLDLNSFRRAYFHRSQDAWKSLFRLHLEATGLSWPEDKPWLQVAPRPLAPIVVNRTPRYHNEAFPWRKLIQKHGGDMVFLGTRGEYEAFSGLGLPERHVRYQPTDNLLEVAHIVAGAKVVLGNQSSTMAIALGLGVPVVQEVWQGNANCMLKRPNAIYCTNDRAEIPPSWLT